MVFTHHIEPSSFRTWLVKMRVPTLLRGVVSWTLLGMFLGGVFFVSDLVAGLLASPRRLLWMGVICAYLWALVRPIIAWWGRVFPLEGRLRPGRLILHLLSSLLVGLVLSLTMAMLFWWLQQRFGRPAPFRYMKLVVTQYFFLAELLFYWTVILAGETRLYLERWRAEAVRFAEAREQLTAARLAALRGQVRPHFLFNTLHALSAMIRIDAKGDALATIEELGSLLRASLAEDHREFWTLAEETELAEQYLRIEQRRFSDRLTYRSRLGPDTETSRVPRFLLQPLVENAVRHGLEADPKAGRIDLEAERVGDCLVITVENDGPLPPSDWRAVAETRVGLKNLCARLRQWDADRASLELTARDQGGARVLLTLPWETSCPG